MNRTLNALKFSLASYFSVTLSALAHPISVTTGVVDVREEKIQVEIKVMVEDLVLFHDLAADEQANFSGAEIRRAAEDHESFLLKNFQIRDEEGNRIVGKVEKRDLSAIPDEGVQQEDLMKVQAGYELEFRPKIGKPNFLTFLQKFGGERSIVPHVMEFVVLQSGKWLEKPTQLRHGRPHTISMDWDRPPEATPKNWRELREKRRQELERRLGIASYTGLYSYLYLNDRELRHEILVPLLTFEKWLPVERSNPEFLEIEEQEAARQKIAEWFRSRNPVLIDGLPVKPVLNRLQFFGLDMNDFARNAAPRKVSAYQARIGIILSYPAKSPPMNVRMTWDSFQRDAPFLRSVLFIQDEKPTEQYFLKDSPVWEWARAGEAPRAHSLEISSWNSDSASSEFRYALLAGLICVTVFFAFLYWSGRRESSPRRMPILVGFFLFVILFLAYQWDKSFSLPRPDDEALAAHASVLLQNVYRAYDYQSESDVYDALEHSCSGELLEELFLKIQSGLRMREQGGAIARVEKVTVSDMSPLKGNRDDEAIVDCTWSVTGTVEHWGHVHTRENEYSAHMAISLTSEGRGRITEFDVIDEKRVRFETSLRKLDED